MRLASIILCSTLLAGCCWWSDTPLPEPATDHGLSGAESNLDHLTDKRDSRVASAVATAKELSSETEVKSELEVALAMLPPATLADMAFAKERAAKGDDKFYSEQVAVSRALAQAIIEANKKYETEKARKQAEYAAALKEKELALAAEQEARQSDKWTYAGIGLVTIGLLALFLSPMKLAGAGVAAAGLVVGAFPLLSKQTWFLPALVGGLVLSGIVAVVLNRRKAKPADVTPPPQG